MQDKKSGTEPAATSVRVNHIARLYRHFKKWWRGIVDTVDHPAILAQVAQDGAPSHSYAFMVTISAGIATIGLLLNSPAVIIGAMLVSPLMGPIILSGISLSTLNHVTARKGAGSLLLGILLALAVAMAIVYASPLVDPTPEILTRTRPNLFDLLVAILSGLAGGYAVIRGRGGAIVGVAIAPALMPPLAVVGYGLATSQWGVARGAFLLFVTNMAAISLSVTFVATWYGFGRRGLRRELAWQMLLALLILTPLAVPLLFSLQSIARETYVTRLARQALEDALQTAPGETRVTQFQPIFAKGAAPRVDVVLLTQSTQAGLEEQTRQRLSSLGVPDVRFHIDQVVVGDVRLPRSPPSAVANPIQPPAPKEEQPSFSEVFRRGFPLPTESISVDEKAKNIRVLPKPGPGADIITLYRMENELAARLPGWTVVIIPPPQPLPRLLFQRSADTLDVEQARKLTAIGWALRAWRIATAEVVGHASTSGRNNLALAARRAQEVARMLRKEGIAVSEHKEYPVPEQRRLEKDLGLDAFRSVEILLREDWEAAPEQ